MWRMKVARIATQGRDSPLLNYPNSVECFPNATIPYLDVISDLAALAAFSLTAFSFSLWILSASIALFSAALWKKVKRESDWKRVSVCVWERGSACERERECVREREEVRVRERECVWEREEVRARERGSACEREGVRVSFREEERVDRLREATSWRLLHGRQTFTRPKN